MSALTENIQTIVANGHPAFAVVPYAQFMQMCRLIDSVKPELSADEVPHEVAAMVLKKNYSIVKAWRVYLRMSQKEAAAKVGITQAALSQIETGRDIRPATLKRLANAWGIYPEQMTL